MRVRTIIRVRTCGLGIANNITGTNDVPLQATFTSLEKELLRDPLGLTISGLQSVPGTFEIVVLWYTDVIRGAVNHPLAELDIMLGIES
jgi:hypothetical protein